MALAIAIGIQLIYKNLSNKKLHKSLLISSGINILLYLAVFYLSEDNIQYSFINVILIVSLIQIILTVIFVYWSKISLKTFIVLSILLSFTTIFISNRQLYYDFGLRREDYFVERFDDTDNKYHQVVDFIEEDADEFYRIDFFDGSNYSLPFEVSTFNLYSSFQNSNQQYFERNFQILSDRDSNGELSGLGKRKILNSLFKVDYVVAPSNQSFRVPVGYENIATIEDLNVYKNDIPLEFIHPVDEVYDIKDFGNETFKDELILDAAITDDIEKTAIMQNNQSLIREVPYEVDYQNIQYQDDILSVPDANQLTIEVDNPNNTDDAIMLEYTLEPVDGLAETHYHVNDYNIELNGAGLPYSEHRFRNRIPINDSSEITFTFEPNTEYYFKIHNVHYVSQEDLQNRRLEENDLEYNYDIAEGFVRINYVNSQNNQLMVLPIFDELGWELKVNGENAELLNVNSGMIGFELPNGDVEIELNFEQPYLTETIVLAVIALVTLILLENKRNQQGEDGDSDV